MNTETIRPISSLTSEEAAEIRFILTDIDDTLTRDGLLLPEAFSAIWRLKEEGIHVIPVTGRPAGWCDCIVRQWPVSGIVGENGAFAYWIENGARREMHHPDVSGSDVREKLHEIQERVLREITGTRVAKDQFCRIYDLAIDFNEEPPYLGFEAAEKISAVCEEMGAVAKVSSIHVNTWFGNYDKLSMSKLFLRERFGLDADSRPEAVFYCGDSPNDEPMFRFFPFACAVANVRPFLRSLKSFPKFITESEYGKGFAEAVERILCLRNEASSR